MTEPLPPGATIGILGGGQLGRMLSVAAARLGYRTHIYEPGAAPAADVAHAWTQAPWDDTPALRRFAGACALVTYEFENVPVAALDTLAEIVPVFPGRTALATSQDRAAEKAFFAGLDLATAPFALVTEPSHLPEALARTGTPAILKTCRFGYDGKGQARVANLAEAEAAFAALGSVPLIAEGIVPFTSEISVIAARGRDGAVTAYDPGLNVHEGGILRTTTVPAPLPARRRTDAVLIASRILTALDYVGVIGVELFVTPDALVVNEIAPRVHNSGHWTQTGCTVDQFEQHIRAIAGWPLGDGHRYADVRMENLIGDDLARVPDLARSPTAALHLYGKAEARPGRKMGHVNHVTARS